MSEEMYRQVIIERFHEPKHQGRLPEADVEARETNPLCGDDLTIQLKLEGSRIVSAGWTGQGCAISQVSADMLSERVVGMPVDQVGQLDAEAVLTMLGIELSPARLKCALLGLETIKKALEK